MTKFLLEIGADIIVVLTERSPLMQGRFEIPCLVKLEIHPTLKNIQLLDQYENW